jgi:ubiquinone/menaquinone biosynthesis C-methylase UbiE
MTEPLERTRQEFTRQAAQFASSAAINEARQTDCFLEAIGGAGGGVLLDVACGPGIVAAALAPRAREVVAFDLTPEMLEKARQRCAAAGVRNVTFREGSATDLPFADASFDGVVTRLSIHHFPMPQRAMAEMARVLKPGGTLVLADVVSSEKPDQSRLHNAIEVLRDPSHIRMLPVSELEALVRDAGLEITGRSGWEQRREFEEWADIVADPERVAPIRTILLALAEAGRQAGIGLHLAEGAILFYHRWHVIAARKAGGNR